MGTKHQADTSVLPADVRLPFPQLNVGVSQFEDAGAVDPITHKFIYFEFTFSFGES